GWLRKPIRGARPGQDNWTVAVARPKILRPPDLATMAITAVRVSGSTDLILPVNSTSAGSVALTNTGLVNRTLYSLTAPGLPSQDVTNPPPRPMESMPWPTQVSR